MEKFLFQYMLNLVTDFDLIVMGGFYNVSKTYIETLLVGVIKEKENNHVEVFSVGKVSNYIKERYVLSDFLKTSWHIVEREPPPLWYHCSTTNADGRPDVWIEPQKSAVLQIKATDLAPSSAFHFKKSLNSHS